MAPLLRLFFRGQCGPEEPYGSSSFRPSNTKNGAKYIVKLNFHKLEIDTADAGLERQGLGKIAKYLDSDINEMTYKGLSIYCEAS